MIFDWYKDLSEEARDTMRLLGNYQPTFNVEREEIKGDCLDGHVYLNAEELRLMARHFVEVAEWLERRRFYEGKDEKQETK